MIGKFFLNWSLRKSEAEINSFLTTFSILGPSEVGRVVGMAALMHYQYAKTDPEFERLLNSRKGDNRGPISVRILELNRLVNELHHAGRLEDAGSLKLWNITFRCMTHDTLHKYGIALWKIAAKGFPEAKQWLVDRSLSIVLRHLPVRNYCRSSRSSARLGGLIHTAVGGAAGCGAWRTKRSGCAA